MTKQREAGPWYHFIYASVSKDEHTYIKAQAAKAGLSVSNFVKRAVNMLLLDEDPYAQLLEEKHGPEERHG